MAAVVVIDTLRVYQDRFEEVWNDVKSGRIMDPALAERLAPKKE